MEGDLIVACQKRKLILSPFSDYVPLVNQLSVHFQIRDDYMNIQSSEVGSIWLT